LVFLGYVRAVGDFEAELAKKKSTSLMQSLLRASRLLKELAVARKQEQFAGPHPRAAHAALYAHIALEGTRPSVLAERLSITPQAVAQLVRELETMGLVERVPDPRDGRARLVRFTAKGRQDILDGFAVFATIEADLRSAMGARSYDRLCRLLRALEDAAEDL